MIQSNSRVVGIVPASSLVRLTHIIYLLHGFSVLMGILGPALIVTTFLTGWPSIIAVIINYVKRKQCQALISILTLAGKYAHSGTHCFGW